ncbi:MAG: hypothetical protein CL558_11635 [Alphaproteobacteria bacterium]|mgnify:CR=1 FL=1|nr:hypothetical protein [Alphaproteobacteria bacterium]MAS46166.1 hypothetical protein [Alphaproteobacteria bacterium]MAX95651.1 hypothetical protein [Alphaproteobacteria bacterium]MBN54213.1 hypothetical protein [Alphaproteobacteria bacterium]OUT42212.1 MAG: hypothetical protein CBB62_07950 [Micavibrio sp. TMED2]
MEGGGCHMVGLRYQLMALSILVIAWAWSPTFNAVAAESTCNVPKPIGSDTVIVISAKEGASVSTVSIGDIYETITAATVRVAEGNGPLYVFAMTELPIVWKFTGDTNRVRQLVIQHPDKKASEAGSGSYGIPKERVIFTASGSCVEQYIFKPNSGRERLERERLTNYFQKPIDNLVIMNSAPYVVIPGDSFNDADYEVFNSITKVPFEYAVGGLRYSFTTDGVQAFRPDGTAVLPEPFTTHDMKIRMNSGFAGIVNVEVDELFASDKEARSYEVLPGNLGLLQLESSGAIERGEYGSSYLIKQPINRLPGDLPWGHFNVAKGVPVPTYQKAKNIAVYDLNTGQCVSGSNCQERFLPPNK